MEQNMPIVAKKVWHIMRIAYYMLRKSINKKKILLDLNMMMKRGKIAGKALGNLMFHHHNHHHSFASTNGDDTRREYEFSCSNTPLYRHYFTNNKRRSNHHVSSSHYLNTFEANCGDVFINDHDCNMEAVNKVLEMIISNDAVSKASPMLGFGWSPFTRQLRITDSPYPVRGTGVEDNHVDEAAEEFIKKFYTQLKQQC